MKNPTMSSNSNLVDYFQEALVNPAILSTRLVPSLKLDYLTLSIPRENRDLVYLLLAKLRELYPKCKILDLDQEYSLFCKQKKGTLLFNQAPPSKEIVAKLKNKNDLYDTVFDSRLKYNIVIKNNHGAEIYKPTSVCIVGSFAHQVVESHFFGNLDLYNYISSISRIDLKVYLESFQLENYKLDCDKLEEFYSNQRKFFMHHEKGFETLLKNSLNANFACVTLHKRRSPWFLRIYIDNELKKKTCELELKKSYLLGFREMLEKKDVREFNKLCVLHYNKMFDWLVSSSLTEPLIEWNRDFLYPLKQLMAPDEVVKSKMKFQEVIHPLVSLQSLELLKNETYNFINPRLFRSYITEHQQTDVFSVLMVLVFCTTRLVQHWSKIYSPEQLENRIQNTCYTRHDIENELYKTGNDYKIEFQLNDLVGFLGLTSYTNNRKKVQKILTDMMKQQVAYEFEEGLHQPTTGFYQVLESLVVKPMGRGGTIISLVIHPIIMLRFLKFHLIFHNNLKAKYEEFLYGVFGEKNNSRFPSYAYGLYLGIICCLMKNQDQLFKYVLETRNLNNIVQREKFIEIARSFILEVEKEYRTIFTYSKNNGKFLELTSRDFKRLVDCSTNHQLKDLRFLFSQSYEISKSSQIPLQRG